MRGAVVVGFSVLGLVACAGGDSGFVGGDGAGDVDAGWKSNAGIDGSASSSGGGSGSSSGGSGSGGDGGGATSGGGEGGSDGGSTSDAASGAGDTSAPPGWSLAWSDEFDGPDGSDVDPTKWVHDVGDGSQVSSGVWQPGNGWGNDELEYYTPGNANTKQQGGLLIISAETAGASAYKCWYGACKWTSGRIKTYVGPPSVQNLFARQYGRFEMRAQIPSGSGLWPAFWMMGTSLFTANWPACGELDIMESVGDTPGTVYGTSHSTATGDNGTSFNYVLPNKAALSDAFHVYALEWSAAGLTWYLDDVAYGNQKAPSSPTTSNWPFSDPNDPFFIIVNLALSNGDNNSWGAAPNAQTANPAQMKVDYVRVYTK